MRTRLAFCRGTVALILSASALVSFAAPSAPPQPSPVKNAPPSQLEAFRFCFGKAASRYHAAEEQLRRADIWSIYGEIRIRSADQLIIWGTGSSTSGAPPSHPAWLLKAGNIVFKNPETRRICYDKYAAECLFVKQTTGRSALGGIVPVRVFTRLSPAILAEQQASKEAERDMKASADALIGYVLDECEEKVKAQQSDPGCFRRCGDLCWQQFSFMAERGLDGVGLRQYAAMYAIMSAEQYAKRGDLRVANDVIRSNFALYRIDHILNGVRTQQLAANHKETLTGSIVPGASELADCARAYVAATKAAADVPGPVDEGIRDWLFAWAPSVEEAIMYGGDDNPGQNETDPRNQPTAGLKTDAHEDDIILDTEVGP